MQLSQIVQTSVAVTATSARRAKITLIAECLRTATAAEVPVVVGYLSGELPQRQIGVGWAALRGRRSAATTPTLTPLEVDAAFSEIGSVSGKGSVAERRRLIDELFGRATADEQDFLLRLLSGELRQGALDGVMADAVAGAADVPPAEVRRAVMFRGSLGAVAEVAFETGVAGLAGFGIEVGRPIRPMLASSAANVPDALAKITPAAVEWKLDGIRVQAHVAHGTGLAIMPSVTHAAGTGTGPDTAPTGTLAAGTGAGPDSPSVRLFTRTLDEITDRLPEVVAALAALPVRTAVFDGELIALRDDGRPHPFQITAARTARRGGDGPAVPLSVFLFDIVHLDGEDLVDRPDADRNAALARIVPESLRMPRLVTASERAATAFFDDAVAAGHEGVVVKSLDTPYVAGRRGAGWIKVKPRHTLDLVVLAAEWGHGRRRGRLSNLHLGARGPDGDFVMLGKTFKGLTDEMLAWQTERLLELEERRDDYTVYPRLELVVEIAFDGVQRSPRYPGGMALRFARVLRFRPDKTAAEADTIDTVRDISGLSDA